MGQDVSTTTHFRLTCNNDAAVDEKPRVIDAQSVSRNFPKIQAYSDRLEQVVEGAGNCQGYDDWERTSLFLAVALQGACSFMMLRPKFVRDSTQSAKVREFALRFKSIFKLLAL